MPLKQFPDTDLGYSALKESERVSVAAVHAAMKPSPTMHPLPTLATAQADLPWEVNQRWRQGRWRVATESAARRSHPPVYADRPDANVLHAESAQQAQSSTTTPLLMPNAPQASKAVFPDLDQPWRRHRAAVMSQNRTGCAFVLADAGSSTDDEAQDPSVHTFPPRRKDQHHRERRTLLQGVVAGADRMEAPAQCAPYAPPMASTQRAAGLQVDCAESTRGKYLREGAEKRLSHDDYRELHLEAIRTKSLGSPCDSNKCLFGGECLKRFSRLDLQCMHEDIYGTSKHPNTKSSSMKRQKEIISTWCSYTTLTDGEQSLTVTYSVPAASGQRCCRAAACAVYDLRCLDAVLACARKGRDALRGAESIEEFELVSQAALRKELRTAKSECIDWFMEIFELYDHIPDEDVIVHPRQHWKAVYEQQYVPYAVACGTAQPFPPDKHGQPPGPWFQARKEALRQYSIKLTGFDADKNGPIRQLKLKERPDHSNFAECKDCAIIRRNLADAVEQRQPKSCLLQIRTLQMEHIQDVFAERHIVAGLRYQSTDQRSDQAFVVDDKLGSQQQFLPKSDNGRDRKDIANNHSYQHHLMGVFCPTRGNFYFAVPPMLKTGANFGCTAFVASLYRLMKAGRLRGVRRLVRQTDSGSDNVSWVTFGLFATLIREGIFDQIDWLRIMPGHSHNEADARHRQAMQVFHPRAGTGSACCSPLQFETMLVDGLKGLPGGFEMMWQLANFDFAEFLSGCVSDEFGHYKDKRWWRFIRDPDAHAHGGVKVLFKEKLTDTATSTQEEWKPFDIVPGTELDPRYVTRKAGVEFMDRWPDTTRDPGVEPFQAEVAPGNVGTVGNGGGGWDMERVEKDVLNTGLKLGFTDEHIADWNGLFAFFRSHTRADTIPKMPAALNMPDGRVHMMHGAPLVWREMWDVFHEHARQAGFNGRNFSTNASVGASGGNSNDAQQTCRASNRASVLPLPLVNGVTGRGTSRAQRKACEKSVREDQMLQSLPLAVPQAELELKKLYFCELQEAEGQLRVGLCRLEKVDNGVADFSWYCRRNWQTQHFWPDTPTFDPFKTGPRGQVEKGSADVGVFLPIDVTQTILSGQAWQRFRDRTSIAGSQIRLTKQCVRRLIQFCKLRRPDLCVDSSDDVRHAPTGRSERRLQQTDSSTDDGEEGEDEEEGEGEEEAEEKEEGEEEEEEEELEQESNIDVGMGAYAHGCGKDDSEAEQEYLAHQDEAGQRNESPWNGGLTSAGCLLQDDDVDRNLISDGPPAKRTRMRSGGGVRSRIV